MVKEAGAALKLHKCSTCSFSHQKSCLGCFDCGMKACMQKMLKLSHGGD